MVCGAAVNVWGMVAIDFGLMLAGGVFCYSGGFAVLSVDLVIYCLLFGDFVCGLLLLFCFVICGL